MPIPEDLLVYVTAFSPDDDSLLDSSEGTRKVGSGRRGVTIARPVGAVRGRGGSARGAAEADWGFGLTSSIKVVTGTRIAGLATSATG